MHHKELATLLIYIAAFLVYFSLLVAIYVSIHFVAKLW
jgi:hypothetical protein